MFYVYIYIYIYIYGIVHRPDIKLHIYSATGRYAESSSSKFGRNSQGACTECLNSQGACTECFNSQGARTECLKWLIGSAALVCVDCTGVDPCHAIDRSIYTCVCEYIYVYICIYNVYIMYVCV